MGFPVFICIYTDINRIVVRSNPTGGCLVVAKPHGILINKIGEEVYVPPGFVLGISMDSIQCQKIIISLSRNDIFKGSARFLETVEAAPAQFQNGNLKFELQIKNWRGIFNS